MIKSLAIKNFKAHSDTSLELKNLNILSGINGVGKSSVFQALLLLRQSHENNVLQKGLQLNKPYSYIGNFEDAIYQYAGNDTIEFSITTEQNENHYWKFKPEKNNLTGGFVPLTSSSSGSLEKISVFNDNFQYLSASRMIKAESNTFAVESKKQLSLEKGQAELVAHFLYYWGKEKKEKVRFENLLHSSSGDNDLLAQTSAWERVISPNVNVVPVRNGSSYVIKYSFNKPDGPTNEFSSENVGFGLSYALPIIVAALSADKSSLILIENPEAHLHASGQSELAKLLAFAAQNGVQIILETHSEHIINGILVACKRFEQGQKGIDKDLVKIYHFKRDDDKHFASVIPVKILVGGKIDRQPKDFFEQTEIDLNDLLGF